MMEQTESIESPHPLQKLTPKKAAYAVLGGYSHVVNNGLASFNFVHLYALDSKQLKKHTSLEKSFRVNPGTLNLKRMLSELNQESVEKVVKLTARLLKEKIEEKIRENLELSPDEENPAQVWFRQAEEFYFLEKFSDEDKQAMRNSLRVAMIAWENLEALADPKRKVKPGFKLEKYPGSDDMFDFREQLTLPR